MRAQVAESRPPGGTLGGVGARRLRICMFVYNNCASDARVLKEAATLAEAGHQVQIVAVLDKRTLPEEERGDTRIVRIDRNPLHYKLLRMTRRSKRRLRLLPVRIRRWRSRRRRQLGARLRAARTARAQRARQPRAATITSGSAVGPARPLADSRVDEPPRSRVAAAGAASIVVYRALRWRVLRVAPPLRRVYYRRRSGPVSRNRLKSYRARAEAARVRRAARLRELAPISVTDLPAANPAQVAGELLRESEQEAIAAERIAIAPAAHQPPVVAETTRPLAAPSAPDAALPSGLWARLDRRLSRAAYRAVMTLHKPLLYLDYYWRAYRLVRNAGFDAFHAHDLNTLPIAALASRRHRARLVYDAHELYSEVSTLSALERRTWRIIERLLIGWADSVITVCESIANELSRRYHVRPPRVLLNCPPRVALPRDGPNLLRQRAGLEDSDEQIVLYQGGFAVHRGLPQLIEAAAYLERGVVVLMGWGTLEVELRTLIARLDLTKKVRIIGPASQPELLRVTAGADVGVIPYLPVGLNNYYTTPNKLFEYIAAGVPVVGSRLPELRRFVEGYGLGLTYHPDEPQDLARALRYVLDQPAILAEMRANAAVAHGRLNWDEQKATLLSLYGGD
jgi:glycosyltransferase involved in cell wall biosynthesis